MTVINEEYIYGDEAHEIFGSYHESGFTIEFDTYEFNSNNVLADLGTPTYDEDGDGDKEFGANDQDDSRVNDREYLETYSTLTQDDGEAFTLVSFDVQNGIEEGEDENGFLNYDYFEFRSETFDEEENALTRTTAFTEDGETWRTYLNVYDYDTNSSTNDVNRDASSEDVAAIFTDVTSLEINLAGEFTVDDLTFA